MALLVLCIISDLVEGCACSSPCKKQLVLGSIGWDENVAVSNLTKVLLEDELGYQNVQLKQEDVGALCSRVWAGVT